MYWFKIQLKKEILQGRTQKYVAGLLETTEAHISNILNGKYHASKMTAYAIVKLLDKEKEVEDYFYRKEK